MVRHRSHVTISIQSVSQVEYCCPQAATCCSSASQWIFISGPWCGIHPNGFGRFFGVNRARHARHSFPERVSVLFEYVRFSAAHGNPQSVVLRGRPISSLRAICSFFLPASLIIQTCRRTPSTPTVPCGAVGSIRGPHRSAYSLARSAQGRSVRPLSNPRSVPWSSGWWLGAVRCS